MRYLSYAKKCIVLFMVSVMLSASVGSSLFRGYDVKASSVVDVVGGSALFEFLLGLFGVSVTVGDNTPSALPLYNEYLEYLRTSSTQLSYDEYEALASGNVVTISQGLVGSVQDFLEGKFNDLSSGSVHVVSSGTYSYTRCVDGNSRASALLNYAAANFQYYFAYAKDYDFFIVNFSNYEFPSGADLHLQNSYWPVSGFSSYTYYPSGEIKTSHTFTRDEISARIYSFSSEGKIIDAGELSTSYIVSIQDDKTSFAVNLPVPFYIHNRNSFANPFFSLVDLSVSGVSLGGYSKKNLDSIMGKSVSGSTISATNTAVSDAVSSNTITDAETGAISYTDEIAQAVADAVAKALSDAGVIDKPGTGEGEGEGEGEETEKPLPWVPDLLGKLDSIKDAIVGGLQDVGEWIMDIPQNLAEFFTTLWEWLQRIWEAICALPGQIADAFERFFLGDGTGEGPGEGEADPPDGTPFLADLTTLFPFCVPFDLIRLFQVLQAAPQAPYWEVPLDVPSIGLHYKFVIDMSEFETLAQIVRAGETIGFICGLILITRKLIKG